MQVHTIDGETVRTRRLGNRRIELITSDRKKDIQRDVCKVVGEASFTSETVHDNRGNVICRLPDTAKMSFEKFITKIAELFAACVKRYNESVAAMSASQQTTDHPPKTKQHGRRYRKRHRTPAPALT